MSGNSLSFEDAEPLINDLLEKRRYSWKLTSISWFDFDDIKQEIKLHIYKKWEKRDPDRPVERWLNTIITNQLINEIRNNFKNYARPCLNKCPYYLGGDECASCSDGLQGSDCLAFYLWERGRKRAYNVKLPVTIEDHSQEISNNKDDFLNLPEIANKIHEKMKKILTPKQYSIYKMFYIDKFDEDRISKILKFKTTEKNRKPGYKQIKNIKNDFIKIVKKIIDEEGLVK